MVPRRRPLPATTPPLQVMEPRAQHPVPMVLPAMVRRQIRPVRTALLHIALHNAPLRLQPPAPTAPRRKVLATVPPLTRTTALRTLVMAPLVTDKQPMLLPAMARRVLIRPLQRRLQVADRATVKAVDIAATAHPRLRPLPPRRRAHGVAIRSQVPRMISAAARMRRMPQQRPAVVMLRRRRVLPVAFMRLPEQLRRPAAARPLPA